MLLLFKKLSLNYLKIFIYLFIISISFRLIDYFTNNDFFLVLKQIWILISSTSFIGISTYFLYEFLYTKKYYFYHTIKFRIHSVLGLLSIIFIIFNFLYYLTYVNYIDIYNFIQKFISLSFYFILTTTIFYLFKKLDNSKIAVNSMMLLLMSIIALLPLVFTKFFINNTDFLLIGVAYANDIRNIYAGIIPLSLIEKQVAYLDLAKFSLIINTILLALLTLVFYLIRKIKINWK